MGYVAEVHVVACKINTSVGFCMAEKSSCACMIVCITFSAISKTQN